MAVRFRRRLGIGSEPSQLIATAQFLSNAMVLNGAGVRLHADPLTLVNVCVSRNFSTGDSTCKVSLSGYFVDLP